MKKLETFRKEIKYVIPTALAYKIKADLSKIMDEDEHNKSGGYLVRSLYFDSINNIDYFTKTAGTLNRKKIRLRIYDSDADICKLELKSKHGDNQYKQSLIINKDDAREICYGNYNVIKEQGTNLAIELYSTMMLNGYHPVALIDYNRSAFICSMYDTRITIDSEVRTNESCIDIFDKDAVMTPRLLESTILEIKYSGNLMGYISDLLAKYNLTQSSYSKFMKGRTIYGQYI